MMKQVSKNKFEASLTYGKFDLARADLLNLIKECASYEDLRPYMIEAITNTSKARSYNSHDSIMKLLSENEKHFKSKKKLFEYIAVKARISIKAVEKHYYNPK